jgi:hypothetical protein
VSPPDIQDASYGMNDIKDKNGELSRISIMRGGGVSTGDYKDIQCKCQRGPEATSGHLFEVLFGDVEYSSAGEFSMSKISHNWTNR